MLVVGEGSASWWGRQCLLYGKAVLVVGEGSASWWGRQC